MISYFDSPLGKILIAADELGVTGLWFVDQKYYAAGLEDTEEGSNMLLELAKLWLMEYFDGNEPTVEVPLNPQGTVFQKEVWDILLTIPYGKTVTYQDIANEIAKKRGIKRMSAQAVGSAVGHNKISLIIPCHRVIGTDGSLTGYAGGIERKKALLEMEKTL